MRRRDLMRALACAPALGWLSGCAHESARWQGQLHDYDALGQADLVRQGAVSPQELAAAAVERIRALNPLLNAVTPRSIEDIEQRVPAAELSIDGPFSGVPTLFKDLLPVRGMPWQAGSRMHADRVADRTQPVFERLQESGLIVLGKSTTPEFGLIGTTESLLTGATANPWSLAHSAGGSSGGAASAVASGMVPIASASDGGGSIRIPASCCGLFGLKPTMGRVIGDAATLPQGLDVHLCVSRSVRDTAAWFAWVDAQRSAPVVDPTSEQLRVKMVVPDHFGREPAPEVRLATERAGQLLEALGHRVEPGTFNFSGESFVQHFMALWSREPRMLEDALRARSVAPDAVLEPWTLGLASLNRRIGNDGFAAALEYLHRLHADYEAALFGSADLLLSPVLSRPPVKLGEHAVTNPFDALYEDVIAYVSYTPVGNVTGVPGMSLPLHWSPEGLPIGVQVLARRGEDERLLALALQVERARPWADRWPPMSMAHLS